MRGGSGSGRGVPGVGAGIEKGQRPDKVLQLFGGPDLVELSRGLA